MNERKKQKVSVYRLCLVAMAIVMNVAGAQLALALRLPIYLDSIGKVCTEAEKACVKFLLENHRGSVKGLQQLPDAVQKLSHPFAADSGNRIDRDAFRFKGLTDSLNRIRIFRINGIDLVGGDDLGTL